MVLLGAATSKPARAIDPEVGHEEREDERALEQRALLSHGSSHGAHHTADLQIVDEHEPPPEERDLRVLFVGNSYTRFNNLTGILKRMVAASETHRRVRVDREAVGGATLRRHWQGLRARRSVRFGGYDHVVLQDHSLRTLDRPQEFYEYVRRFAHQAEAAGADVILYSTWSRRPGSRFFRRRTDVQDAFGMHRVIEGAYTAAARNVGAQVAPVGRAFLRAATQLPEVPIYKRDGAHPTTEGTYLAACVFYGMLTGMTPVGAPYVPYPLSATEGSRLQAIAAEAIQSYRNDPIVEVVGPTRVQVAEGPGMPESETAGTEL